MWRHPKDDSDTAAAAALPRVVRREVARAEQAQALARVDRAALEAGHDPALVRRAAAEARRTGRSRLLARGRAERAQDAARARIRATAYTAAAQRAQRAGVDLGHTLAAQSEQGAPRAITALSRLGWWAALLALVASVALSVGSGYGIARLVSAYGAAPWLGYLVEAGLTVVTTATVAVLGVISRYSASGYWIAFKTRARKIFFGGLIGGPLSGSVLLNVLGFTVGTLASVVSIACAIGAALCALFAHMVTVVTAEVRAERVAEVTTQDAADLFATATDLEVLHRLEETAEPPTPSGAELAPVAPLSAEHRAAQRAVLDVALDDAALRETMLGAIATQLGGLDDGDGPDGGGDLAAPPSRPGAGGPAGAAAVAPDVPDAPGVGAPVRGVGSALPTGGRPAHPAPGGDPDAGAQGAAGPVGGGQGAHPDAQQAPTLPTGTGATGAQGARPGAHPGGQAAPMEPTPAAVRGYARAYPALTRSQIARHFGISRRSVGRYLSQTEGDGRGQA